MVKYYYAGTQRLAMRTGTGTTNANLTWLFGDHLGSTSVTADLDGDVISRTLYKPWGGRKRRFRVRYQSGTLPTKYTYTGQYSHTADFGLMYYVARWYDPVLGRFAQADPLIPMPFNPLSYDRFGYVFNNPINYTDPSGLCRMVANPYGAGTHFEYSEDCTVEEFNELSWTYRILWLQIFAQIHELGDWLDDIKQVIIDFSQDPDLNDLGGYIALADAAVLQAIQNGWRMYTGQEIICGSQCDLAHTAAEGWSAFFGGYKGGGYTLDELISMRLGAEQGGVNYATALADEQGLYDKASPTEQVKISLFIWGSNLYRDFGATYHATGAPCPSWSLCPVVTDPRRSTDFLGPLAWTLVPTIATIAGAIADCFYATGNASCFTGGGR